MNLPEISMETISSLLKSVEHDEILGKSINDRHKEFFKELGVKNENLALLLWTRGREFDTDEELSAFLAGAFISLALVDRELEAEKMERILSYE